MKEYVVRVVLSEDQAKTDVLQLLECLRYAGVLKTWISGDDASQWFDLYCPDGLESITWANQKAAKFESHGFNAVAAPRQL